MIEKQAYQLQLLLNMRIYNIFHVLLLKLYTGINKPNDSPPPPIEVKKQEKYKVKKILNSCIYYNKLQYLVK